MKKQDIVNFIGKYHLTGVVESVKWTVEDKKCVVSFNSEDKTLIGKVAYNPMELEDSEFGIFDTTNLVKQLSACKQDVKLKLAKSGDKFVGLTFDDGHISQYVLADTEIIPAAGSLKSAPEFNVVIPITSEFISDYSRYLNGLVDATKVGIRSTTDKVVFVLGYDLVNTNRTELTVDATVKKDLNVITFSSEYLRYILNANKDATNAMMSISDGGLMKLQFKGDGCASEYYLVSLNE